IPGNDDASRAINLYCDLMVGAVLDGLQAEMAASGADVGAFEAPPEEVEPPLPEEVAAAEPSEPSATEGEGEEAPEQAAAESATAGPAAAQQEDEPRDTAAAG